MAAPDCFLALNYFDGGCWPSESDDESLDLAGSLSSSVSLPASGTSGSERVAWNPWMALENELGHTGCCVKAKHKAHNRYFVWSLHAGELLLSLAGWRIHPFKLIIVK